MNLRTLASCERVLRIAGMSAALCGTVFFAMEPAIDLVNGQRYSWAHHPLVQMVTLGLLAAMAVLHAVVVFFGFWITACSGDRRMAYLLMLLPLPGFGWVVGAHFSGLAEKFLRRFLGNTRPRWGWSDAQVVAICDPTLCPTCGYSLVGNTSGTCPECGQPGQGSVPASKTGP